MARFLYQNFAKFFSHLRNKINTFLRMTPFIFSCLL